MVSLSLSPSSLLVVMVRDVGYPPEMDDAGPCDRSESHLNSISSCTKAEDATLVCANSPASAVAGRDGRRRRFAGPPCRAGMGFPVKTAVAAPRAVAARAAATVIVIG